MPVLIYRTHGAYRLNRIVYLVGFICKIIQGCMVNITYNTYWNPYLTFRRCITETRFLYHFVSLTGLEVQCSSDPHTKPSIVTACIWQSTVLAANQTYSTQNLHSNLYTGHSKTHGRWAPVSLGYKEWVNHTSSMDTMKGQKSFVPPGNRVLRHPALIWHSEDRASWYILIIKPRCTNFSNLFLE